MKNNVNMLQGSIYKGLLAMTMPIMLMNVMQRMFNVIDMTVLGKFADDTAVGAVGACGSLTGLCTSLFIGISVGANVVIAKHIGRNDKDSSQKAVGCAILFSILSGIVLGIIGATFSETFLRWTNCPEKLLSMAVTYFRIYFIGVPIFLFYTFCAAILRSIGDTKRLMYYSILGGITKVLLNLFTIIVLDWGVKGVAISTIICNGVSGALCFRAIVKSNEFIRFDHRKLRLYPSEIKQMLRIGIPTGLQSALYSFANTVIVSAVNSLGPNATTGLSIANEFDGILYTIIHSPSLAVVPFVAQNLGAKNAKRIKETIYKSIVITTCFGASFGALSAIFSGQLSSIMSSTPEVIMYSQQKMIIVSSTYFICGINEVLSGSLRGLGKPVIPTISTFIFMCLLRVFWVQFIFPLNKTLTLLYLVWPVGWIMCIIVAIVVLIPTLKKIQNDIEEKRAV